MFAECGALAQVYAFAFLALSGQSPRSTLRFTAAGPLPPSQDGSALENPTILLTGILCPD